MCVSHGHSKDEIGNWGVGGKEGNGVFVYVWGLFVCIQSCEWFSGVNVHVCKVISASTSF